jgi:3',5'-cyclic AMP phosphodiesterase CpdA
MILFTGCRNNENADYSNIVSNNYNPSDVSMFVDELGYNSIKINANRDIKILQLTDIHIGNGFLCVKKDEMAMKAVCKLIEYTVPDLIILTGDVVYPNSLATGTNDNLTALKILASTIEMYKTPWTMVFGNHDAEFAAKYTKSELCDFLESDELKYCLFDRGDGPDMLTVEGMGNHFINIYNADNSINSSMVMIDNGMYVGSTQMSGYSPISQNQANWYSFETASINWHFKKTVPSYMFYHVPAKEYEIAWEAYRAGDPNVTYYFGWANENDEKISSPDETTPLTEIIKALQSTRAVFCGHNHLNDFSITYEGIRYTFSKSIDYIAYPGIANKTEQRGGTLLTLKGLDSLMTEEYQIKSIKLSNIPGSK